MFRALGGYFSNLGVFVPTVILHVVGAQTEGSREESYAEIVESTEEPSVIAEGIRASHNPSTG